MSCCSRCCWRLKRLWLWSWKHLIVRVSLLKRVNLCLETLVQGLSDLKNHNSRKETRVKDPEIRVDYLLITRVGSRVD